MGAVLDTTGFMRLAEDATEKVFLLRTVPLFAGLDAQQLAPVTEILQQVDVEEYDVVFEEGQEGHALYIIADGEVDILKDGRRIASLTAPDCFGEMAVLDHATRSATVQARTDVALYKISREDFQDLVELYPALSRGIIKVLAQRVRNTTRQISGG